MVVSAVRPFMARQTAMAIPTTMEQQATAKVGSFQSTEPPLSVSAVLVPARSKIAAEFESAPSVHECGVRISPGVMLGVIPPSGLGSSKTLDDGVAETSTERNDVELSERTFGKVMPATRVLVEWVA